MRVVFSLLVLIVAGGMAYIRLAPSDPARWHVNPYVAAFPDQVLTYQGFSNVVEAPKGAFAFHHAPDQTPEEVLQRLDAVAIATPRTVRLAGSPEEGMITWVTRSAVFGFPDYSTAEASDPGVGTSVSVYARLRFGRSDLGVNAARLRDWLGQLTAR